jgi:putative tricarboxylic transport membrane protein
VPYAAAYAGLLFATLNLLTELFRAPQPAAAEGVAEGVRQPASAMPGGAVWRRRAARYFAWLVGFLVLGAGIGFLPALFCFVLLVMRLEFRERWTTALAGAGCVSVALWLLCDRLLALPWPQSALGDLLPALREVTGLI